jgi:hypothetical protein
MNKLSVFFALLFLTSCNQNKETATSKYPGIEKVNDSFIVYSPEDYGRIFFKDRKAKIKCIDTLCPFRKNQALADLKAGKRIYFVSIIPQTERLKSLLAQYGIECRESYPSDTQLGDFDSYCYQSTMNEYICNAYGKNFIDSLTTLCIKKYITQHPNEPWMEDGKDRRREYLNNKKTCKIYTSFCTE